MPESCNKWKYRRSRDLYYVMTFKLDLSVGHSGQLPVAAISTIIKILILTAIACYLGGPFSVFPKKETLIYSHVTYFCQILLVVYRESEKSMLH